MKAEESDLWMQLPFWFCSSDPAGMALKSHRGKSLHPSRLVGLFLKPVKLGRGKWSSLQVLRALHWQCSESVNMLSCRCNEGSDCWKEKKKRVMDQCHSRIHSQQTWAVCSCLVSLHLLEVWVLPFDSFYPFKQQPAHKINSTEPQLRLEADILNEVF